MSTPTPGQILDELAAILGDFDGREYSGEISPETLFFGDIGLTSIDAVVLAEKLERHYGRKFPFHEFVAEMRTRAAFDIAVGDLVAFLHRHLGG